MIFLISGKAESGKSTLAKYLTTEIVNANYASYCIPFAGAVKKIAKEMGWDGNKDEKGRNLLQFIGEQGRQYDPDIWVKKAMVNIDEIRSLLREISLPIIIDDVRYKNEIEKIEANYSNVIKIRINRPNHENSLTEAQRNDKSEIDLDDYKGFDFVFTNDEGLEKIESFANMLKEVHLV